MQRFVRRILFGICGLLILNSATLHDGLWILEKTTSTSCKKFQVDELHNLYLLHDDYIEMIRQQNQQTMRLSLLEFGSEYTLDVTNPLQPFLFYPTQGVVIHLDNTLSQQATTIRLQEMGFEQVEVMAGSRGDYFWLWDAIHNELLRVDRQFQIHTRTGNLAARLGRTLKVIRILERDQDVILQTESGEIILLDIYGTYKTSLQLELGIELTTGTSSICWMRSDSLYQLDLRTLSQVQMPSPVMGSKQIQWVGSTLYVRAGEVVYRYRLE